MRTDDDLYETFISGDKNCLDFCIMEYGAWTASCIFEGDTLANLYYWFDIGVSLAFVLLIVAVGKAVDNELY